jgi:hypothetical protein
VKTRSRPWSPTRSGGYSLDEAARICKGWSTAKGLECPHCGGTVRPVVGSEGGGPVCVLRCEACERTLVMPEAPQVTAV